MNKIGPTNNNTSIEMPPSRERQTNSNRNLNGIDLIFDKYVSKKKKDQLSNGDYVSKMEFLRSLPISYRKRLEIRSRLPINNGQLSNWASFKQRQKRFWSKAKTKYDNFTLAFELWRNSIRTIEGHFGPAVTSYFAFLKWLFILNFYIFLISFGFVVLPQILYKNHIDYPPTTPGSSQVEKCSNLYKENLTVSKEASQLVLDFLQGTGWMERTLVFYGYYSDKNLLSGKPYNLPLAYILVIIAYLVISLILMARQAARALQTAIITEDNQFYPNCNLILATWDYSINEENSIFLKSKAIYHEVKFQLMELERKRSIEKSSKCKLYLIRILANITVILLLAGAAYLIVFTITKSTELKDKTIEKFVRLCLEFMPSLTITFLNILLPLIFEKLVIFEKYSQDTEILLTLVRTVFLRLASLVVLIVTIYTQVTCKDKDIECNVGINNCPTLRCWETYTGQQLYKLVLIDFLSAFIITFFVELPRKIIVTKCNCKLSQMIGLPEFVISKHVLDLVYGQTLCWLATFFSPLIPTIAFTKTFLLFYLKKFTCLYNYTPSSRLVKMSRSQTFFTAVLISSFLMCCIPIGYVIWQIEPSKGCGPFRTYNAPFEIINEAIDGSHDIVKTILSFITSAGAITFIFVCLCLATYYYSTMYKMNTARVTLLREQIERESQDKAFLMNRVNKQSQSRISDKRNGAGDL